MSDNKENKVVEVVVDSVAESTTKSKNALYVLGAGLFVYVTYVTVKKCYEHITKNSDE